MNLVVVLIQLQIKAAEGTNIVASANGTVILAKYSNTAGNYVIIEHDYNNKKYYSIYMHMSSLNVNVSDKVLAKQKIGVIGKTGQVTGTHLHFEICTSTTRNRENCINPRSFIKF